MDLITNLDMMRQLALGITELSLVDVTVQLTPVHFQSICTLTLLTELILGTRHGPRRLQALDSNIASLSRLASLSISAGIGYVMVLEENAGVGCCCLVLLCWWRSSPVS